MVQIVRGWASSLALIPWGLAHQSLYERASLWKDPKLQDLHDAATTGYMGINLDEDLKLMSQKPKISN